MKIKTMFLLAALVASGSLHAESVEIPVLYRNPAQKVKTGDLLAFGFYENETRIVLAFQIKNLQEFMKQPKAVMSFYADTDNDLTTGRFPNTHGWDFQINVLLNRKTISSMLKWNGNEAEYINIRGKYTLSADGDMLYITFPKSIIAGVEFKQQFRIRTLDLTANKRVDQQKPFGVFPEKFNLPEDK